MTGSLSPEVQEVLAGGILCYLAVETPLGPHVTPLVYALHGSRLWFTTSRGSVKARAWRAASRVGGLVRSGSRAVTFLGVARAYDLLDPSTWLVSVLSAPTLTRAAVEFTRKNARFFAGYAVDAYRVPLAWTPPGRVFAEVRPEAVAILDVEAGEVGGAWGPFPRGWSSRAAFRATRRRGDPLERVPADVRDRLGRRGMAALAVQGPRGPFVLPVRWTAEDGVVYAACTRDALALAGPGPDPRVGLAIDESSRWRARTMAGVLLQGDGAVFAPDRLSSGARAAAERIRDAGADPEGAALVRIRPERVVWWRGWSSGTVALR